MGRSCFLVSGGEKVEHVEQGAASVFSRVSDGALWMLMFQSVDPPLWSRLKYLTRHSWRPDDESW